MDKSTDLFEDYRRAPGKRTLARLVEHHQAAVLRLCRRVLRHPQDAEDACQEVLLEMSRQVDCVQESRAFAGWLYQAALHTALDVRRKRARERARASEVVASS